MSQIDTSQLPETRGNPALLMGAASPLWGYFGAVAAGGVAYWWMTRWTRPMNAEAVFGAFRAPAEMSLEVVEVVESKAPGHPGVAMTEPEAAPLAEAMVSAVPSILSPDCEPEVAPLVATSLMAPPPEPEPEPTRELKPVASTSLEVAPAADRTRPSTPRVRKQTTATPDAEA